MTDDNMKADSGVFVATEESERACGVQLVHTLDLFALGAHLHIPALDGRPQTQHLTLFAYFEARVAHSGHREAPDPLVPSTSNFDSSNALSGHPRHI